MRVSATELAALVRRAALGRGWGDALAAEAGQATVHLCRLGGDGAHAALAAVQEGPAAAHPSATEAGWHVAPGPVLALGPSLFDLLELRPEARVTIAGPTLSPLIIGYAALATERFGAHYRIWADASEIAWCSSAPIAQLGLSLDAGAERFTISRTTKAAGAPCFNTGHLCVVPTDWRALADLAAGSYVASTAQSRSAGAGAGLTDND